MDITQAHHRLRVQLTFMNAGLSDQAVFTHSQVQTTTHIWYSVKVDDTNHTEPYAPVPICLSRVNFSGTSHVVLLISSR